ncbi:hypothetical protein LC55x_1607 [Lysobacter capsici]|nr:hypothetical protein LC55x_1607 [Lysobacter capsici]
MQVRGRCRNPGDAADRAPRGGAMPTQPMPGAPPFARRCSPPLTD